MIVQAMLAGGDVELPTMPRAGDDVPLQRTFSQWSAGMGTDAVQRIKFAVNMIHCQNPLAGENLLSGSRGNISNGSDTYSVGHRLRSQGIGRGAFIHSKRPATSQFRWSFAARQRNISQRNKAVFFIK